MSDPLPILHYCKYQITEGEMKNIFVYGKYSLVHFEALLLVFYLE